jgi:hypothetical protein
MSCTRSSTWYGPGGTARDPVPQAAETLPTAKAMSRPLQMVWALRPMLQTKSKRGQMNIAKWRCDCLPSKGVEVGF